MGLNWDDAEDIAIELADEHDGRRPARRCASPTCTAGSSR